MIKSMTGYGKSEYEQEGRKFTVEIKSINHRFQEISVRLPKILNPYEEMIRKYTRSMLHRGKIDIFINYENSLKDDTSVIIDEVILEKYLQQLKYVKEKYSLIDDISVSMIANLPDIFMIEKTEENQEVFWDILHNPLQEALKQLLSMRQKEGALLKENILDKIEFIEKRITDLEANLPIITKEYKQKLEKRVNELLQEQNIKIDEVRLATEVAIFADRTNIDEEIVRLRSHLFQLKHTLELKEPVGRKIDFIIQEMNREINTIGSKSSDVYITSIVVDVKSELEKIREQIQNIE